ncbi:hypothetical protein [uncultured Brevundimonas sp.]|uniref:hypothetical protein n=1 Tax=uncultured Brevundimonas sp. TaxID=213418 RepID=UPI002633C74F|nr:hypothetical protein [uncultured Brevundimonas sp.]
MAAILSERPPFPPSLKGQGGSAVVNAAKALREAQTAFFRPVTQSVQAEAVLELRDSEPVTAPEPAPNAMRRPGSLLDIRV